MVHGRRIHIHLSGLVVSISPNSSLLPPLLEVAVDVVEAADMVFALEWEEHGLSTWLYSNDLLCLLFIFVPANCFPPARKQYLKSLVGIAMAFDSRVLGETGEEQEGRSD